MKYKRNVFCGLLMLLAGTFGLGAQAQNNSVGRDVVKPEEVSSAAGPTKMVRTVMQDRKGSIWLASAEGMIRYDGKAFTNITGKGIPARFTSVLEDSKGKFWFGAAGAGVYHYDGTSFKNLTIREGLANNGVNSIYEDKAGNIWFGTEDGATRYDGQRFTTIRMKPAAPPPNGSDSAHVSQGTPKHNDVNAMVADKAGKIWFGTKADAVVYDGKAFATITDAAGDPLSNVRAVISDKKGNIWLGGNDGLWRYDGDVFIKVAPNVVNAIYQDKKGNLWTATESAKARAWVLSRYDEKTLNSTKPSATEIKTADSKEIFSITEATDGSIWFGSASGVYRYDGKIITDFKAEKDKK